MNPCRNFKQVIKVKIWNKKPIIFFTINKDNIFLAIKNFDVILNWQTSLWNSILAGISIGLVLEPLLFLIYLYNSSKWITSICKILAEDTSLSAEIENKNLSTIQMISNWTYQWKMLFNPGPYEKTIEVCFSQMH